MKPLKLGMVGGGEGAFIGAVHRIASRIDGDWELVAGALSSDPERARRSGEALGLANDRIYDDFYQMAEVEAARADGIDAVAIVTPNFMHAAPAIAFLQAGVHVICDKPLAGSMDDAKAMADAAEKSGASFYLTHNYTGYPLVRQAREMVARGDLGKLRLVQAEYVQDWLAEPLEESGNKQADWRTDPKRAGAGAIGDIGTHAFNLASFVTGLSPEEIAAELSSFVDGRQVDDNAFIHLRYKGGARGQFWVSQIAVGNENALRLRVVGEKASLDWAQETPNVMRYARLGEPVQILTRGMAENAEWTRTPPGHPEGYLEAFANIYTDIAQQISGQDGYSHLPNIHDGLAGMRFIASVQESSRTNGNWVKV